MNKERNIRETLNRDNRDYYSRNDNNRLLDTTDGNAGALTVSNEPVISQCCDRNENIDNSCRCKNSLKRSLDILLNPFIKSLINLTSFTLIGRNFITTNGGTTLKTVSNCNDGLITYSDPNNPAFNSTTVCDLVLIAFSLLEDDTTGFCPGEIRERFINCITRCIPPINPRSLCRDGDNLQCCNKSKALFLSESIGPVNLKISSSAYPTPLYNFTVITVNNNIAWLINDDNRVIIVCLDDIEQFG